MRDITQGKDENPALFQGRLVEALRKYTNTGPNSPEGQLLLAGHFILQGHQEEIAKGNSRAYELTVGHGLLLYLTIGIGQKSRQNHSE